VEEKVRCFGMKIPESITRTPFVSQSIIDHENEKLYTRMGVVRRPFFPPSHIAEMLVREVKA
jgi:hypothetical protein